MTIEEFKEYVKTGQALEAREVRIVGGVPARFIKNING